ncbi:TetR/AcrR family transcriptional regulator [Nocardioides marmorisolisilvae]|uniref:TetR/AcrR family transcriptional regulator n=1 Tax=Nocardioides marmorisolisilvae TaxID=1542737 RepID=A0A3N0E0B5_9ACTN|nr:TetR/AcrR family transcriptional regulator [Nocardioides marmorisolisilvae]RNL81281.1 TetR/AcrR family transcriptional regulator [Nocardioides marmorisolisilvae]
MGSPATSTARSYGGKTAAERTAERRERLIEATINVLAEAGEGRATMTAICSGAGLTERYFYESFANLDEAMVAAFDHVCSEILTLAAQVIENTPGTPEQRVHAVMETFVEMVVTSPSKGKVAVMHTSANPELRGRRNDLMAVFSDFVAREADELYGERTWPAERARVFGVVYIAGFAELISAWLNGDVAQSPAELVDTASDLFTALFRRV